MWPGGPGYIILTTYKPDILNGIEGIWVQLFNEPNNLPDNLAPVNYEENPNLAVLTHTFNKGDVITPFGQFFNQV